MMTIPIIIIMTIMMMMMNPYRDHHLVNECAMCTQNKALTFYPVDKKGLVLLRG